MNTNLHKSIIINFLLLFSVQYMAAQNRLWVSSTHSLKLDLKSSHRAGGAPSFMVDDTKWLNYQIQLEPSQSSYSISVQIASGSLPDGFRLKVKASDFVGTNGGDTGNPTGEIYLTHQPQILISNIGTSYTGSGTGLGHQLSFSVEISKFKNIGADTPGINLLYTINQDL